MITDEMVEAGARAVWSGGTRGLPDRDQHIRKILTAALAVDPVKKPFTFGLGAMPIVIYAETREEAQAIYRERVG